MRCVIAFALVLAILSGCGGSATPDPAELARLVDQAVKATVAALPTPLPETVEVEKIVKETVIVEKVVEVTVVVEMEKEVEKEVVVTATPEPEPPTPTPTAQQPIEIGDPLILAHKAYDNSNLLDVFVLLRNPNPDWWMPSSQIMLSVFDAGGNIIGAHESYIVVGPGQEVPFVVSDINLAENTHQEVQIKLVTEEFRPLSKWPNHAVRLAQGNVVGENFIGQIENTGEVEIPMTRVVIVVRDSAGELIGLPWTYAEKSQPGQTIPFDKWDQVFEAPELQFDVYLQPEMVGGTY